ncbi:nickel pincer cofactor biosynthesis protein LarB [Actinacidiphila paucisporea]|uniref:nickel pincer cofactor biosynthesis protein LarB n=1 Tax=Actinacidiphila paucisporea TaxID=310782 RepID=UPI001F15F8E8|nr:nickel pincer cofactor biosynthesis protein LarB [Actinacidiphila paucisporea]
MDLGFAQLDVAREQRQGMPEVVYGPGKTPRQIAAIMANLLRHNTGPVLATRVDPGTAATVLEDVEGGTYHERAGLLVYRPAPRRPFRVTVISAGTSDGPVTAEAAAVCTALGLTVEEIHDAGVAGLDRVIRAAPRLQTSDAVIVVAGMEGALASVVGGLVRCPVVAVPTSTGYGASLEGVTALLAMHASCAAGVTVVNIDSGFGAAMAVHRITQIAARSEATGAGPSKAASSASDSPAPYSSAGSSPASGPPAPYAPAASPASYGPAAAPGSLAAPARPAHGSS